MIYDEEDIDYNKITYYYFECKECKERWFSTFAYCPRCHRVHRFKILSHEEAQGALIQNMIEDQIHFVMLNEWGV
jgi:hypothetical protein